MTDDKSTILMAIDPGKSGGLAMLQAGEVTTLKMPETITDLFNTLNNIAQEYPVYCLCELVGGYRSGNSATASATFNRHIGHLEMALVAARIQHSFIGPAKWMRAMFPSAPKGSDPKNKKDRKNYIKDQMQRKHPQFRVTLWNADALALLDYLRIHSKELGVW